MNDPATTGPLGLTHRPALIAIGEELSARGANGPPRNGMDSLVVSHVVLKTAYTVPQLTTEWAAPTSAPARHRKSQRARPSQLAWNRNRESAPIERAEAQKRNQSPPRPSPLKE